MADVKIPFGDNNKETAILLLAAAESLGRGQWEVRTNVGFFVVDEEIANEAGLGEKGPTKKAESQPAKKASAKKAPAKKTAAKKTAKKSSPKKSQE